jgi:hypothetical protein
LAGPTNWGHRLCPMRLPMGLSSSCTRKDKAGGRAASRTAGLGAGGPAIQAEPTDSRNCGRHGPRHLRGTQVTWLAPPVAPTARRYFYSQRWLCVGLSREGRVGAGGGVDSRDAVAKPTGTYSRRPPPDTTRPGQPQTRVCWVYLRHADGTTDSERLSGQIGHCSRGCSTACPGPVQPARRRLSPPKPPRLSPVAA